MKVNKYKNKRGIKETQRLQKYKHKMQEYTQNVLKKEKPLKAVLRKTNE